MLIIRLNTIRLDLMKIIDNLKNFIVRLSDYKAKLKYSDGDVILSICS